MSHYSGLEGRRGRQSLRILKGEAPGLAGCGSGGKGERPTAVSAKSTPPNEVHDKYLALRKRNNVAVRKSREKQRAKQTEVVNTLSSLKNENSQLQSTVAARIRELHLLNSLLRQVNHDPPERLSRILSQYNSDQQYVNTVANRDSPSGNTKTAGVPSSSSSSNNLGHNAPRRCTIGHGASSRTSSSTGASNSAASSPTRQSPAASRLISSTTYGHGHPQPTTSLHGAENAHIYGMSRTSLPQNLLGYAPSGQLPPTPHQPPAHTPANNDHIYQPHSRSLSHISNSDMPLSSRAMTYNSYPTNGYFQ